MEGPPHGKSRVDSELNSDFISGLPAKIKEEILVKLRIKEAVRTSILSKKWRYSWMSIPKLAFKENCTRSMLVRWVDSVLLVHQGPILNFELVSWHLCNEAIGRWMLTLSRNGIKDLRLFYFRDSRMARIPSSLFSCDQLEHVEMHRCIINAPQCFQGLKLLRCLELYECNFIGISIEKLVSSCPLLESLSLVQFTVGGSLVIRAPNLRQFLFSGEFTEISLETPKLIVARVEKHGPKNFGLVNKSRISRTLGRLSEIEELGICGLLCTYLASGPIPEKLPVTFDRLKKISIGLICRSKQEAEAALCIFQSAPNLKALDIEIYGDSHIWEFQPRKTEVSLFQHLEMVNVYRYENTTSISVLRLAEFILRTAPELEKLDIEKLDNNEDGSAFVKKLLSLPRLSSKAKIVLREHSS